jgi:hypothetical protein
MGSTVFRSDHIAGPEAACHAALYVAKLPKAERELPQWETAIDWLMLDGEHDGDPMVPQILMIKRCNNANRKRHRAENPPKPIGSFDEHRTSVDFNGGRAFP